MVQLYVPELDRIVLKDTTSERPFASTSTCRKAVFTTRVLGLVHELCTKQIHVTKRDLFYTDVKLFEVRDPVLLILYTSDFKLMACAYGLWCWQGTAVSSCADAYALQTKVMFLRF